MSDTLDRQRQALHHDLNEGRWITLHALADLEEEAGHVELAMRYRWLARWKRWPVEIYEAHERWAHFEITWHQRLESWIYHPSYISQAQVPVFEGHCLEYFATPIEALHDVAGGKRHETQVGSKGGRNAMKTLTTTNDEFIVYSLEREAYVESLDTYDGSTKLPQHARIFRGADWRAFWSNAKYELREVPSGDPNNDQTEPSTPGEKAPSAQCLLRIRYTNWKGETTWRRISPSGLTHGPCLWHPEHQWYLRAFDLDEQAMLDFALINIRQITPDSEPNLGPERDPSHDPIENPSHYDLNPKPYLTVEGWGLSYHLATAVTYIARAGRKETSPLLEDLKKALWHLKREIERREGST